MPLTFVLILLMQPLLATLVARRLYPKENCARAGGAALLLFLAGLAVAAPFLTSRAIGTGEAYNYSLALADGVLQMRAGEIPPLAGQTEFAYNGRVHPLRTAPYLFYLGRGLDILTGQSLTFWELQNLTLAFSLLAALQTCYLGLRWGLACSRRTAVALSLAYGLCPALLTSVYYYDLFMTIHAAPFLPLVLAACLRQAPEPHPGRDGLLAASLAATWFAHPPVALWISLCAAGVRGVIFLCRPTAREFFQIMAAVVLTGLLAAFALTSVRSLANLELSQSDTAATGAALQMGSIIRSAFPASLLPMPSVRNDLGNFQLGYAHWALLALALGSLVPLLGKNQPTEAPASRWARFSLVFASALLLVLTLPVPGITLWLWKLAPYFVIQLTTIWPMQRLYLVATALIIFAAAAPLSRLLAAHDRKIVRTLVGLGLVWTVWQAWPAWQRGFHSRWSETATALSHLSTNLDLTSTSYAYLDTSSRFINGVMDPLEDFRLIRSDGRDVTRPDPQPPAPILVRGSLTWPETDPIMLKLEPNRRYLLAFSFGPTPIKGHLKLSGTSVSRTYYLPAAGNALGFGMGPTHRHTLSLWTSAQQTEEVRLDLVADPTTPPLAVAEYTLQEVDALSQPVKVHSLMPLHCTVDSPDDVVYLETCRRYLPDYQAIVNGQTLMGMRSPNGQLMVPVPRGRSDIVIRYVGAASVRQGFVISAISWLLLGLVSAAACLGLQRTHFAQATMAAAARARAWLWQRQPIFIGLSAALILGLLSHNVYKDWQAARATGPIRLELRLPDMQLAQGHAEPLVVTGRTGAGDFAYLRYVDSAHVVFGLDHWGHGGITSEAIPLDHSRTHTVEIHLGALYPPLDDPRWGDTPLTVREQRRKGMSLLLDGRLLLKTDWESHPTTREEITIGVNRIGGSSCEEKFSGQILKVTRELPTRR